MVIETSASGEVFRRPIESTQFLAIRYTDRLHDVGITSRVGSRGDAYDNALAETINGRYKAEVIHHLGPWKGLEDVEYATLEWVAWYNTPRLMRPLGDLPPAECEAQYQQTEVTSVAPGLN
jgi:putative transposase